MMKKARWVGLVLAGLLAGASVLRAETRILFISSTQSSNASHEIYSMTAQGSNLVRITYNDETEWGPVLAPDGYRIAYVNTNRATGNLFLTDMHGHAPVAVGNTNQALAVQWGDTNTLYYLAREAGLPPTAHYSLWRIGADGSGQAQVYTNTFETWPLGATSLAIDRAAQRVYLAAFSPPDGYSLLVSGPLAATAPDLVRAGSAPMMDHYNPAVSPNAALVAFTADLTSEPGNHRLHIGTMSGSTATQLCDIYCGSPAWGPDGSWLAFTRSLDASSWGMNAYQGDIWRVATNGSGLVCLTSNTIARGTCAFPQVYEEAASDITQFQSGGQLQWRTGLPQPFTFVQAADGLDRGWTSRWLMATGLAVSVGGPDGSRQWHYRLAHTRASLKAWYPLTNNALDASENRGPLLTTNAPFAQGGIYCNGIYYNSDPTNGCEVRTQGGIGGLDLDHFAISAQFMVTSAPAFRCPVFMGGLSYRWAGFYLNAEGQVGLCVNNANYIWSPLTFRSNVWHEATLAYDADSQVCGVYLDGVLAASYVGVVTNGADRTLGVTHYGNSQTLRGYLRQLKVMNLQ